MQHKELYKREHAEHEDLLLWVCNETDAQLIIFKYKKNTMKRKRKASYKSERIMCFSLKILVSN